MERRDFLKITTTGVILGTAALSCAGRLPSEQEDIYDVAVASSENVSKCRDGYYYEPSVAEHVFNSMIGDEENITVLVNHQLNSATVSEDRIEAANFTDRANGMERIIKSKVFVDATYEGDLYAHAGAAYRLGREGKSDFNEQHAGQIFFDYNDKIILKGTTGQADKKLPAYTRGRTSCGLPSCDRTRWIFADCFCRRQEERGSDQGSCKLT